MQYHEGQQEYCSLQLSGPEMANARGPSIFVQDAGTTRLPCAAERRWRRPGSLETNPIMSIKYEGASPCRHLCTKAHVLNRILWCTGSQWNSSRMAAEMRSYFRILRIRTCSRVKNGLQWSEMNRTGTIQNTVAVVDSTTSTIGWALKACILNTWGYNSILYCLHSILNRNRLHALEKKVYSTDAPYFLLE